MTANLNTASPRAKRILLIAANPAVSPTTGWPIGFWAAELTHPYWAFTEAGYQVDIVSPSGGKLQIDSYSDPRDASGYSASDILSLGFLSSPTHAALLDNTPAISTVKVADYDAVFLAGGQSPMVSFIDNAPLHQLVAAFWEAGKVVSVVCHATCVLLKVRLADGSLLAFSVDVSDLVEKERALDAARAQAQQERERLEDALEALPDGFALFDADDRLVVCNQRYREIYERSAPAIRAGAHFEDLLRYGLARGQYPGAEGRESAWLEERL